MNENNPPFPHNAVEILPLFPFRSVRNLLAANDGGRENLPIRQKQQQLRQIHRSLNPKIQLYSCPSPLRYSECFSYRFKFPAGELADQLRNCPLISPGYPVHAQGLSVLVLHLNDSVIFVPRYPNIR
ncbi:hypothetical protein D3C77_636900 [compost metagenome]